MNQKYDPLKEEQQRIEKIFKPLNMVEKILPPFLIQYPSQKIEEEYKALQKNPQITSLHYFALGLENVLQQDHTFFRETFSKKANKKKLSKLVNNIQMLLNVYVQTFELATIAIEKNTEPTQSHRPYRTINMWDKQLSDGELQYIEQPSGSYEAFPDWGNIVLRIANSTNNLPNAKKGFLGLLKTYILTNPTIKENEHIQEKLFNKLYNDSLQIQQLNKEYNQLRNSNP